MVGRGKRPMQATVAVMRKLLHVLHAMFRKDELCNGARLPSDRSACSVDDFFVGAVYSGLTENRLLRRSPPFRLDREQTIYPLLDLQFGIAFNFLLTHAIVTGGSLLVAGELGHVLVMMAR